MVSFSYSSLYPTPLTIYEKVKVKGSFAFWKQTMALSSVLQTMNQVSGLFQSVFKCSQDVLCKDIL